MRIAALDIGKVRTGFALSDASASFASPVCVLRTKELMQKDGPFARYVEDEKIQDVVVGLPFTQAGEESDQAFYTRKIATSLEKTFDLCVHYQDERLTSREAKRIMHEEGYKEKDMRGKLDAIAASLLLEAFLKERNGLK